jgi:hypothetical protein
MKSLMPYSQHFILFVTYKWAQKALSTICIGHNHKGAVELWDNALKGPEQSSQTESLLAGKTGWKNDLSIAPILLVYAAGNLFLVYESTVYIG